MKALESFGGVVLIAALLCYFTAFSILIVGPFALTNANEPTVIDINGNEVEVPPYTETEAAGREVYIKQVCWHCHSQFVRPVNEEDIRWGPVSQPGESVMDVPHLYSTRRIGPDLAREGWRRVDDWHLAHLWDPRTTVRDSVMPAFTWLFFEHQDTPKVDDLIAKYDTDGDGIIGKYDDKTHWPEEGTLERKQLTDMLTGADSGGVLAPNYKQKVDGSDMWPDAEGARPYDTHDQYTGKNVSDGLVSDYDARPRSTQEAKDAVEYLQRLGIAIGPWRKPVVFGTPTRGDAIPMKGVTTTYKAWVQRGTQWALEDQEASIADGLMPQRDLRARRYGVSRSKASDAELKITENYSREYDALMAAWRDENGDWDHRLEQGETLYMQHCASCHGDEGRGNGIGAQFMIVRPRDFTRGKYRYRSAPTGNMPLDGDLFRTLYRGLPGSAMPHWKDIPQEHIWLLVDYIKSLRESIDGERGAPFNDRSKLTALPARPKVADMDEYERLLLRGKAIYVAMTCNSCHGTEGMGDGPGWNDTGRDNGGSIRPRVLRQKHERDITALRFRAGVEPEDLYRTIFNGLDGVGMPVPAFEEKWKLSDKLDALAASGASQGEIDAVKAQARQKLNVPLKDPQMLEGGIVVAGKDAQGNYAEFVERIERTQRGRGSRWKVGDDWALIMYVRSLAGFDESAWLAK